METKNRSMAKMLIYRALSTVLLAVISWLFTGNAGQTTIITVVYGIAATAVYYVHERAWNGIGWGNNNNNFDNRTRQQQQRRQEDEKAA